MIEIWLQKTSRCSDNALMYKWCSYCQKFLGEIEPRHDFQMSHGICPACKNRMNEDGDAIVNKAKPLKDFFNSVREDLLNRKNRSAAQLVAQALEIGIAPYDILAGVIQPLLYEIAKLQSRGEVSICAEHEFSVMVEDVFYEIKRLRVKLSAEPAPLAIKLVLACADSNYHAFGIRFVAEYLIKEGIPTKCVYPSLPFSEIIATALTTSVAIIGISVSTTDQSHDVVEKWARYIARSQDDSPPFLILGGQGIKPELRLPARAFSHAGSLSQLKELIDRLLST